MKSGGLKIQLVDILKKNHLLSAQQIVKELSKNGHNFHKTSIYRAIEKLLDDDVICRYQFDPSESLYELRDDDHAHLHCSNCGKITSADFAMELPKKIKKYQISHHHLTFVGLCGDCQ